MSALPRIAFAGDRDLSVDVLTFILDQGAVPLALLVSDKGATHDRELISLCPDLEQSRILRGKKFREPEGIEVLGSLDLDYLICIHFPYLVPIEVLSIPKIGAVNLHPAFLPYNRGWHTPSWAILDGTPYGATLHFMDEDVDTGAIVHQKAIDISAADTADSLYKKVKGLELEVFKEAWDSLVNGEPPRRPQLKEQGSAHRKEDLLSPGIQQLDPEDTMRVGDLIDRLRALTTDRLDEAAYVQSNGRRYRIQVSLEEA